MPKAKMKTSEQILREQEEQADTERNSKAIARAKPSALVTSGSNPWIEIGAELERLCGMPRLRFTKQGEFAISDTVNIPDGTRCIAHANEIEFGWQKWVNGQPADTRMGRVADRFVPAQRSELGDDNPAGWETQDDGTRRDPWQFQATVPITRLDTSETYQFTTSSKGGLGCVTRLTRMYGGYLQQSGKVPGRLPIVELRAENYKHKTYGKIFTPAMHVVGWSDSSGKPLSLSEELNDSANI
jgi:hypothetical protein